METTTSDALPLMQQTWFLGWRLRQAAQSPTFARVSQPTVSHHLAKLRAAGFVEAEHRGIWTYYALRRGLSPEVVALLESVHAWKV